MTVPFKRKKLTVLVAIAIAMMASGCAAIQKVGDLFAGVDKLNAECHVGVTKLALKGINVVTIEQCDKAAAEAKTKIQELVDKVRAEIAKAGL
jgi:hypothetical protein